MTTSVPNFALYGDEAHPAWLNVVHIERIPERSSPHDFRISPHVHEGLIQLLYVVSGGGEVLVDGIEWKFYPQTLIVVPAGRVHGFRFSPDIDGPVITAAQRPLEAALAAIAPEMQCYLQRPLVLDASKAVRHVDAVDPIFAAIEREARTYAGGDNAAGTALLVALFVQIVRIARSMQAKDGVEGSAQSNAAMVVDRFRSLVDRRFHERLPVERYAAELGVTAGHLSRLCRECLGMSSLDVINARIVHEAQRELVYSRLSIKALADALGFADDTYFGRFFKKQTGLKPTEFRESARVSLSRWSSS